MLMRGGTSKGAFFVADDLPADPDERDRLLLGVMGSPDVRQIDGIGGATPLTSKVAVVRASDRPDADIDYHFLQVSVDRAPTSATVRTAATCSPPRRRSPSNAACRRDGRLRQAAIRVYMVNTDSIGDGRPSSSATVSPCTEGTAVDRRGARHGGSCAASTSRTSPVERAARCSRPGNAVDVIDGVEVTLIDNGMPVVVMRAADLGISGSESPADLEADAGAARRGSSRSGSRRAT